jgi:hypothetical protein
MDRISEIEFTLAVIGTRRMSKVELPAPADWGHGSGEASSDELVHKLVRQTIEAMQEFSALPVGP